MDAIKHTCLSITLVNKEFSLSLSSIFSSTTAIFFYNFYLLLPLLLKRIMWICQWKLSLVFCTYRLNFLKRSYNKNKKENTAIIPFCSSWLEPLKGQVMSDLSARSPKGPRVCQLCLFTGLQLMMLVVLELIPHCRGRGRLMHELTGQVSPPLYTQTSSSSSLTPGTRHVV